MAESELNEYRRDVGTKVFRIAEVLDHIAKNDFTQRVEIAPDDDDGFGEVSRRLNGLMIDLERVKGERDEQALVNELRTRIWELAADESLDEKSLIEQLVATVGPAMDVDRVTFSRADLDRAVGVCEVAWCREGLRAEMNATFPWWLVTRFLKESYRVVTVSKLPAVARSVVVPLLERFGVGTCLVVPYGDPGSPRGVLAVDRRQSDREWRRVEIGLFTEVARIAKVRADQIVAHRERMRINDDLERKVSEQTAHLEAANQKLHQDIIDLKLAEEALKESEERFRAVAQGAHEAIVSIDGKGDIVFWNRGAEIMFAYTDQEMIGKSVFDLVPEAGRERMRQRMREMATGNAPIGGRTVEADGRRKDGTVFPVELSASTWRSRDQAFFTAVIRDVTERKKAERDLAEEKKLLDTTLASIADGVLSADTDGRVLLLNTAAEAMTGWREEDADGRSVAEVLRLVDPKSSRPAASPLEQVIRTGAVYLPREAIVLSTANEERHVTVTGAPLRDGENQVIGGVLVLHDITEKQRIEEELFKARKLESVGLLAGGIAHDFNNILTGIVTNLFMAKMGLKKDDEPYQLINEAETAAFRASKLTKQLLTFAKGGAPVKETASIRELVEESVGFSLSGSNVDCRLDLPDDLWPVDIDRGQIDQVLNNLIVNANQAMLDGGTVTVTATNVLLDDHVGDKTEMRVPLDPGRYVKISVRDEGVGIPRKNLQRIFDPYFTTKKNCTGLGLTTVFAIVQKHGGFITAKSTLGKGATFVFYLPASAPAEESDGDGDGLLPMGGARILVMDDDEVVRVVIERLLRGAGHEVRCVANGSEAIGAYREALDSGTKFDAVIMDLTIPGGMGGRETVREILAIDPDARVIVASGYSNDPIMSEYEKHGFCGVIKKPFSIEEFSRVIARVLGG